MSTLEFKNVADFPETKPSKATTKSIKVTTKSIKATTISLTRSLTRPVRDCVGRKLHERGCYNIEGLGEITTIDEFRERAFAIQRCSRKQTLDDVARLRKKYEQPII